MMGSRQLYAVGCGLGLVGSLVAVAGLVFAGEVASSLTVFVATFTFLLTLRNIIRRDDFDRDHSLAYRVVNWVGGVFVLGLGLLMLVIGIVSLTTFG